MCHFINTVRKGRIKKHQAEAEAPQEGSRRDWHFQVWGTYMDIEDGGFVP